MNHLINTPTEYMRLQEAANYLQISKPTLWRLEQTDKDMPAKIRITSRCCVYRKSDLDAYLLTKQGA